jgi:hypothetical protein
MSVILISILQIVLGLIVLTTGFKLPWFFVGVIFFVFGMYVLMDLLHLKSRWGIQIIGLAIGVTGIVLWVYIKPAAILMVSFISGGYGAYYLAQMLGIESGPLRWKFFTVTGILGIILVSTRFEWGLILLSSWGAATLIGKHLHPRHGIEFVVFLGLTLFGLLVQGLTLGLINL